MHRYLALIIWLAGMSAVIGVALLLVRRLPTAAADGRAARRSRAAHGVNSSEAAALDGGVGPALSKSAWLLAICSVGALVVYGLMALLGLLVVHHGLSIDQPIHNWLTSHQVHKWAALMKRLTKIGDTWTCWGAAGAAAVCLSVTWRAQRWLPPAVFIGAIIVDHFTTLALRHTFHRLGPPQSPLGTYPSGGCDRVILFYGLIAYLLWREFSRQPRTGIWAGAAVAALGFNEAYSRVYLSLHWFTDALSGLLYGTLLLTVFIAAIHIVAGPVGAPALSGQAEAESLVVSADIAGTST
jgi:membrane-associated phospholipid phosphatase